MLSLADRVKLIDYVKNKSAKSSWYTKRVVTGAGNFECEGVINRRL